jgi:hypothetical protein
MEQTSWTELNFIERKSLPFFDIENEIKEIDFIDFVLDDSEKKWMEESNKLVMDFSGVFHSIYLRWAVTINGLNVAEEKYRSKEWENPSKAFVVAGIRNGKESPEVVYLKQWDGKTASEIHKSSIPMLAGWAFCNMYSVFEEFIFKLYKIYLEAHPLTILEGREFRDMRVLYQKKDESDANLLKWQNAWNERLEKWHRKKLYDGLEKIFNSYINLTKLEIPAIYNAPYSLEDVSKTIGGISLIRNCFIHGMANVPKELGDFCKTFQSISFNFIENEKFTINLNDLMTLEYFSFTFTQTLNNSFNELAFPIMKEIAQKKFNKSE